MPSADKKFKDKAWSDKDVETHWDSVSDIYIRENNKVKSAHDQRFLETIKHLELQKEHKVLNITSRDCEANDYIKKTEPEADVLNAEISQGLIDEAKKVRPYVNQVKIETYSQLPFKDKEFDRIVCLETLEHVKSPVSFLKELYRVSTPNARMVLSCPPLTSEFPYHVFTLLFGGHGEGPHRFIPSREVKKLLLHTGWKLNYHYGSVLIPFGPLFLQKFGEWLIRKFQKTYLSEFGIRQFYICEK
ncbi:MAG: class I SAM-dependent methyltransferase [Bacteroidales bacterium]|nr:class I SAM-dependent methyltransferase [Bacteroidales bacterium]MBN2818208.1 class I SAM-dependent methyltransferase [Bacteroidales bacterium]